MTGLDAVAAGDERPLRLILVTQWFDPEPTFKGLLFARGLRERGFDVEVVTGFPNYPGGTLYHGYKMKLFQGEVVEGVAITRLPLYPSHGKSRIGRVANYVSFFLSAFVYLTFFARRADLVYAYHPPLTVALAARFAEIIRRTPVALDIQDMWPDTLRATGMVSNERLLRIVGKLCLFVYRGVDRIVVLSPGFRRLLIARGVPSGKIEVIYNWADENAIAHRARPRPQAMADERVFRVLFAGNMGVAQALEPVLEAAEIIRRKNADVELCFLGAGVQLPTLKDLAQRRSLTNVRFIPSVPMSDVGAYLAAADCLLVHLRRDPLFAITIPSKTQAYMAAGKPLLMAVEGDAADLVRSSGGGVVAPPENPEALAKAILDFAAMDKNRLVEMGARAAAYYMRELSLSKGLDSFARLFRETAGQTDAREAPQSGPR